MRSPTIPKPPCCEEAQASHVKHLCGERNMPGQPQLFQIVQPRHQHVRKDAHFRPRGITWRRTKELRQLPEPSPQQTFLSKPTNCSPATGAVHLSPATPTLRQCGADTTATELPSNTLPKSLICKIVLFYTTRFGSGLFCNNRKSEHRIKF